MDPTAPVETDKPIPPPPKVWFDFTNWWLPIKDETTETIIPRLNWIFCPKNRLFIAYLLTWKKNQWAVAGNHENKETGRIIPYSRLWSLNICRQPCTFSCTFSFAKSIKGLLFTIFEAFCYIKFSWELFISYRLQVSIYGLAISNQRQFPGDTLKLARAFKLRHHFYICLDICALSINFHTLYVVQLINLTYIELPLKDETSETTVRIVYCLFRHISWFFAFINFFLCQIIK